MIPRHLLLALSISLLAATNAWAARHALLFGNDDYKSIPKLKNAGRDADAMAVALRQAKYEVTLVKNRTLRQMKADLRQFKSRLRSGDEVVLFYAGHGVQIGATNYVLPVDLESDSEGQVVDESIALSRMLADLREQRPALVVAIVDACRDNPFKSQGRSIGTRGLAGVSGATGEMVIYSAGEGQQALDRLGENDPVRNGLFTRVFVKQMAKPGVSIDQVARNVREEVNQLARSRNHEQVPAIFDQVLGDFYFHAPGAAASASAPPRLAAAGQDAAAAELDQWRSVRDSGNANQLLAYVERYPQGQYADIARTRLLALPGMDGADKRQALASAASAGDIKAMARLGRWLENGQHGPVDRQQALHWYQRAADAGDAAGQAGVAAFALNGWEGAKDPVKAATLAQTAAAAGNARAMLTLSLLYGTGTGGLEKNDRRSGELLQQAASLGFRRAALTLAQYNSHSNHPGISKDSQVAVDMVRLALEPDEDGEEKSIAGDVNALMGEFYRFGFWDIPKDETKAREFLNRSIALGSSTGMVALGKILFTEFPQRSHDLKQAHDLFTKAAAMGHPAAMMFVGAYHELGLQSMPVDRQLARQWYQRAADAGSAEAKTRLDKMK